MQMGGNSSHILGLFPVGQHQNSVLMLSHRFFDLSYFCLIISFLCVFRTVGLIEG